MVKKIPNYIANQILKAADLIQQWKSQSQDKVLGFDGTTRDPKDFDIGDLTAITNGALTKDILMRTAGKLKNYSGAGALLSEITIDNLILSSLNFNKNYLEGFKCINNSTNPTYQIDVGVGKCLAKDKLTILELTSLTVADLTNHITPAINTTYHLFVYKHSGTGAILLDFSTSLTPTAGTGDTNLPNLDTTKYRRILSIKTTASTSNLYNFSTILLDGSGIKIKLLNRIVNLTTTSTPLSKTSLVLYVPLGLRIEALITILARASGQQFIVFFNGIQNDFAPTQDNCTLRTNSNSREPSERTEYETDINSTIFYRASPFATIDNLSVILEGYTDYRNND